MSEHEPGPWTYHRTEPPTITRFLVYGIQCSKSPGHVARCTTEDNARLIAAAPELLEAVNHAIAYLFNERGAWGVDEPEAALYRTLLAAQSKAEGRS